MTDVQNTQEHSYIEEWVKSPEDIIKQANIDEDSEVAVTGMPRAWFMTHRNNEASSADKLISEILHSQGEDADIKAYRESDTTNVERKLGEPGWRFPSGRTGRNENLVIAEAPTTSIMHSVVLDPDVHVFADAASYTGHELGHEHRQSEEEYGRIQEILQEDLGADTGIVTVKNFPYFHDTGSETRDEADFEEYINRVGDQVDDLYEEATTIGESLSPEDIPEDGNPHTVYVLGKGRK